METKSGPGPEAVIEANSDADSEEIHRLLREYNRGYFTGLRDYSFHITLDGKIAAGVVAGSTADTLEVEFLFVAAEQRGKGLGGALLRHVEALAARDGLRRVLLNTYSFQAPDFYRAHGYTEAARLSPCFGDVRQYFFVKLLDPPAGPKRA